MLRVGKHGSSWSRVWVVASWKWWLLEELKNFFFFVYIRISSINIGEGGISIGDPDSLFSFSVLYIFIVRRDLFWGCFWSYWEITIFVGALLCRYTRILPPILLYFSSLILFRLVIYLFLLILCKFSFWYLDFIIIGKKCMNSVVYMNGNEYCRDPSHTWHTSPDDAWHTFSSGLISSGSPQEYTWRASPIRTPSRKGTRHSQT